MKQLTLVAALVALPLLALPAAHAAEGAHQHGVVKLDVAVDGKTLRLDVAAPLDSLVGFEHAPRTAAQKQAAEDALKLMNDGAALFRPDAAAQCSLSKTTVNADVLKPAPANAPATKGDGHADLDASYEFTCQQPGQLARVEHALFTSFKRIQRINVQLAGAKGQSKQTLKRPDGTLRLKG